MKTIASKGGNTSNIVKHLQHTHDIKLKECGVFDCLDTTNARRLPNTSKCSAMSLPLASVFLSASTSSSHGKSTILYVKIVLINSGGDNI